MLYVIWFVFGVLSLILFFKIWRMCNNVRDIKEDLHDIKNSLKSKEISTKENAGLEPVEGGKFGIGQLVIVKEDERQFRITLAARKDDGTMAYYSDRLNKYFDENELEDFNTYWEERKHK